MQQSPTSMASLPLLKFSHATDPASETTKFSWTHVTQNLTVRFYSSSSLQTSAPSLTMEVTQGTQVLDRVDLHYKANEALSRMDWAKQQGFEMRNEQLPISALVRSPLLAIRYSIPEDLKMRRLQLKFTSDIDYRVALGFVERAGCRITHSVPQQPQSHGSITSSVHLPYSGEPASSRPNTSSSTTWIAPKASNSTLPLHSNTKTTTSSNLGADPIRPDPPSNVESHNNATQALQFQRSYTVPPQYSQDQDPTDAQLGHVQSTSGPSRGQDISRPIGQSAPKRGYDMIDAPQRPSTAQQQTIMGGEFSYNDQRNSMSSGSAFAEPARPHTALEVGSFGQIMPPRRELPFMRPSSKARPDSSNSRSRPSTSTLELPPLPTPKFAGDKENSRPFTSTSTSSSSRTAMGPPILSDITKNAPFHSLSRVPLKALQPKLDVSAERGFERPNSSRMGNSLSPTTEELQPRPATAVNSASHLKPQPEDPLIPTALGKIVDQISTSDLTDLSQYANQSVEDRRATISNWMVQHIADDAFITLCEDVSSTWQRVGLGL